MRTLPPLSIPSAADAPQFKRLLDEHLQTLVEAINHNAKETEWTFFNRSVTNATYFLAIPHVARNIVAINAQVSTGTCDIVISDGTTDVVWKAAASATLGLSSTLTTDTADTGRVIAANSVLQVVVTNDAASADLLITLLTGS